jgi:hypothetical protein
MRHLNRLLIGIFVCLLIGIGLAVVLGSMGIDIHWTRGAVKSKEAALHATGLRTVQAIAGGDAAFIDSIADPKGIYVGYDEVRHPVDSFKNELAHHVGLYCELFEKDCKTDHNPNYSLGHVLNSGAKPTNSDLRFKIDGSVGTLEYWEFGGAGDLIVTFSYRFVGGNWYLYNVHYV